MKPQSREEKKMPARVTARYRWLVASRAHHRKGSAEGPRQHSLILILSTLLSVRLLRLRFLPVRTRVIAGKRRGNFLMTSREREGVLEGFIFSRR